MNQTVFRSNLTQFRNLEVQMMKYFDMPNTGFDIFGPMKRFTAEGSFEFWVVFKASE